LEIGSAVKNAIGHHCPAFEHREGWGTVS